MKIKTKIENLDKILLGLELAYKNLLESKKRNKGSIAVLKNNIITIIKP